MRKLFLAAGLLLFLTACNEETSPDMAAPESTDSTVVSNEAPPAESTLDPLPLQIIKEVYTEAFANNSKALEQLFEHVWDYQNFPEEFIGKLNDHLAELDEQNITMYLLKREELNQNIINELNSIASDWYFVNVEVSNDKYVTWLLEEVDDGALAVTNVVTFTPEEFENQFYQINIEKQPQTTKGDSKHLDPATEWTTLNGEKVYLSNHQGKATVLLFWATYAPPSLTALEELKTFSHHENIQVLTLNADQGPGGENIAKKYIQDNDISVPVITVDDATLDSYNINLIPTSWVISKEGEFIGEWHGAGSLTDFIKKTIN